jgi:hypothetical protein
VKSVEGVSNEYINNAIDELATQLGVKEPIAVQTILKPVRAGTIKGCTEGIAQYLGLPIEVNLSEAPFESTDLTRTDYADRGVAGITAQVSIPSYLPSYGTPGMKKFPIFVRVSGSCLKYPVTFAAIMAHELSHIVLHSLQHRERDNEFYADLTAMILGFSHVMKDGRKVQETQTVEQMNLIIYSRTVTQTTTTTYGYLSDSQFELAFDKIEKIIRYYRTSCREPKQEFARRLSNYEKKILVYKQQLLKFNRFTGDIDKKRVTRMAQEDAAKLVAFHQPGYVDRFADVLTRNEEKLKQIYDRVPTGLSKSTGFHYTTRTADSLRALCNDVDVLLSHLEQECTLLKNDIGVLKKYVGLLARF